MKKEENQFKIKSVSCNTLYRYLHDDASEKIQSKTVVLPDSLLLRQMKKLNIENKDIMQVKFDYAVKDVITKNKIRKQLYQDGYTINDIHYVRLFRTVSKAKSGQCYFINEKYYEDINKWQTMQLSERIHENDLCKLVELEAYKGLSASAIIGTIKIKPSEILIVKDIDSFFEKNVAVVTTDSDKHCIVDYQNKKLKNTLFDGQALIDDSMFTDNSGMMVLRQHFFKACAFRTDITGFMKDMYADKYDTAQVRDMFGSKKYVKNIKLITTDNAIKWLKFSYLFKDEAEIYRHWCDILTESNYQFGIVKTDHASKYGNMQRMSYQMINSLPLTELDVKSLCSYEIEKVEQLKNNDTAFVQYLRDNSTDINSYDMIADLIEYKGMVNTTYVTECRKHIISDYVHTLRKGKIEVTGDNLTVCQNPVEMLFYSIGKMKGKNIQPIEFKAYKDRIQCHASRFQYGKYLAAFRNPHNSPNNVGYYENVDCPMIQKYMRVGNNIIIINGIGTDTEDRCNSMDFDSDFQLVTDNYLIVNCAKECYLNYPTIVNDIQPYSNQYSYTPNNIAKIDNTLSESQIAIGQSSNLAQIALSYYWNDKQNIYKDDFIILSVLAQLAIDSAKRTFDIDIVKEVARFNNAKELNNVKGKVRSRYPLFFYYIDPTKQLRDYIDCPMNYLENELLKIKDAQYRHREPYYNYYNNNGYTDTVNYTQLRAIRLTSRKVVSEELKERSEKEPDILNVISINRDASAFIKRIKINNATMVKMIEIAMNTDSSERSIILRLLYHNHKEQFLLQFRDCPKKEKIA